MNTAWQNCERELSTGLGSYPTTFTMSRGAAPLRLLLECAHMLMRESGVTAVTAMVQLTQILVAFFRSIGMWGDFVSGKDEPKSETQWLSLLEGCCRTDMGGYLFDNVEIRSVPYRLVSLVWKRLSAHGDLMNLALNDWAILYDQVLQYHFMGRSDEVRMSPILAKVMVTMLSPSIGDVVGDPACGIGDTIAEMGSRGICAYSFLVACEDNPDLVVLARMRILLRCSRAVRVRLGTGLDPRNGMAASTLDVALCLPPVGSWMHVPAAECEDDCFDGLEGTVRRIEETYLFRLLTLLKPGGRAAILLPEQFFTSNRKAAARRQILERADVVSIVEVPVGVNPALGVRQRTCLLVLQKRGGLKHQGETLLIRNAAGSFREYPTLGDFLQVAECVRDHIRKENRW